MAERYQFTGTEPRFYTQYLDVTSDDGPRPLEAVPGGVYAIEAGPGYDNSKGASRLPVPPGDGLWAEPAAAETSEGKPATRATKKGASN